jgi:hypothetical protein
MTENSRIVRRFVSVAIIALGLNAYPVGASSLPQTSRAETESDSAFAAMNSFEEAVAIKSKELGLYQDPCSWRTKATPLECSARGENQKYFYRPKLKQVSIPIDYYEVLRSDNSKKCKSDWMSGPYGDTPKLLSGTAQVYEPSRGAGKGFIVMDSSELDLVTSVVVRFNGGKPSTTRAPRQFQKATKPFPLAGQNPCNLREYAEEVTNKKVTEDYHLYPIPKKVGKYDVSFFYRNPSKWDCSVYYSDVCRWIRGGDERIARIKFKVSKKNVVITYHRDIIDEVLNR